MAYFLARKESMAITFHRTDEQIVRELGEIAQVLLQYLYIPDVKKGGLERPNAIFKDQGINLLVNFHDNRFVYNVTGDFPEKDKNRARWIMAALQRIMRTE